MADQKLRRADGLLTELIEMVETARAVPMSSSCVLPRERMLDLLDDLRDAVPDEIAEARRIIGQRDRLLREAEAQAQQQIEAAKQEARELLEAAQAEQAQLVSATGVHRAAVEYGQRVRGEADDYAATVHDDADDYAGALRQDADSYAAATRGAADVYAAEVRADVLRFSDRTLQDLVDVLNQAVGTVEEGRRSLHAEHGARVQPTIRVDVSDQI